MIRLLLILVLLWLIVNLVVIHFEQIDLLNDKNIYIKERKKKIWKK